MIILFRFKPDWEPAAEFSGDKLEGKVPGLTEGQELQFRVVAVNKAGPSAPSDATKSHKVKHKNRKFHIVFCSFEGLRCKKLQKNHYHYREKLTLSNSKISWAKQKSKAVLLRYEEEAPDSDIRLTFGTICTTLKNRVKILRQWKIILAIMKSSVMVYFEVTAKFQSVFEFFFFAKTVLLRLFLIFDILFS